MQNRKHAHKFSLNYFCLFGPLNCLSNKVIQISFFYNNLLRELSVAANIGNYINSQTNLSFIHHNFISELLTSPPLYLPSSTIYYNIYVKNF